MKVEDTPDEALVALARTGDKNAFGTLIERYQPLVASLVRKIVTDEYLVQELMQEVMLQAYLSLSQLHDDGHFKQWVCGITRNVCRSYRRQQRTSTFSFDAMGEGMAFEAIVGTDMLPDPQEIIEASELRQDVLNAIHLLSPENAAAILLFYYGQLSLNEIAETLGVSTVTVKGRLSKARKQLKKRSLLKEISISQEERRERR